MSSLFDKIGTLVNAHVNELLGMNETSGSTPSPPAAGSSESDSRRAAHDLRQRLDQAMDYEGKLQERLSGLMNRAADMDAEIDERLERGDQLGARRLQSELVALQRQIGLADAELEDYRRITQDMLRELADIEAMLDKLEAQDRQAKRDEASGRGKVRIPVDGAGQADANAEGREGKLNPARGNIETMITREPSKRRSPASSQKERIVIVDEEPDPRQPKTRPSGDRNMSRRLSRLSKPEDDSG